MKCYECDGIAGLTQCPVCKANMLCESCVNDRVCGMCGTVMCTGCGEWCHKCEKILCDTNTAGCVATHCHECDDPFCPSHFPLCDKCDKNLCPNCCPHQ